jgi:LPS-assembly protein
VFKNALKLTPFILTQIALSLSGALPELPSIEALQFDDDEQRLVARGDAQLEFEGTTLKADSITYYKEYGLADASGNVDISYEGYRVLADRFNFDAANNVFSVENLRTGLYPYYATSEDAGGDETGVTLTNANITLGEPSIFSPNVSADTIQYVAGERAFVEIDNATLRIGKVPFFYLPGYRHYLNNPPYFFNANAGYDDFLGAYFQTTTLIPISGNLRLGANLDYYTDRGPLVGPAVQYTYQSETQTMVGAATSGFIHDNGDTDIDILNTPIDKDRGFVEWRHKHSIGERTTFTANGNYWTDSEVTRDFREDQYSQNQRPDNFVEAAYTGNNYIVSVFGRFRPNDFQLIQERLPELRYDLLPTPILNTGAYHKLSASYALLREDFGRVEPLITEDSLSDRFDLTYRVQRPFRLTDWLTFSPLAGARLTHYANQEADPLNSPPNSDSFTREIYEVGFDLQANFYSQFDTTNTTWKIDGLRHVLRPVLKYRYFSDPDALNEIAQIDREAFDLNRPVLDLSDLRGIDSISETHLTRLGIENIFQTRADNYGSRTLAALNFYQDILFEKGTRYDGSQEDTLNASWVEMAISPAPWIKLDLASRFRTENLSLEELRTRTTLTSGEIWELGLSTDLLDAQVNQYRIDFIYRLNERYALLTDLHIDAEKGKFTRTGFGLRTRLGSAWEVIYVLTFNQESRRESDVQFSVRLRLAAE